MAAGRQLGAGRGRRRLGRALVLGLCLALPALADPPGPPVREPGQLRPPPRPAALGKADLRCTPDGAHCIALESYTADVCRTIEAAASEAGLDRDFFVRLIWRESLFDASAVSPAGAQGIAQFMPGTALLRRLDDPFNPAKALRASAIYLAELRDRYGNLGLAAAAYNAGEDRVEDFIDRDRILPLETRRYVPAITGYSALDWRDAPPESLALTLDDDRPFREACVELAESRRFREFRMPDVYHPWAVILAANPSQGVAAQRVEQLRRRRPVLEEYDVTFRRMRLPARSGRQVTAQIGADSRAEAQRLCGRLRGGGVPCVVLRN
ncbi:lytic transglycosylase domain-containing protein [Tropicimonas sediminicola]|uniref:Transglycosylase SLT domain-containing protein n=1 Tax=Tropicimonas sediminicola TaxID=1031541 RepID=A0A239H6T3_9RHOB|nr:lytic transglycosylase domain-containing protein [Tropicimonas sediminicola]SNS76881.1 Transglycosylase SLT domain-containing protein [Tropicimonas sediminicola]